MINAEEERVLIERENCFVAGSLLARKRLSVLLVSVQKGVLAYKRHRCGCDFHGLKAYSNGPHSICGAFSDRLYHIEIRRCLGPMTCTVAWKWYGDSAPLMSILRFSESREQDFYKSSHLKEKERNRARFCQWLHKWLSYKSSSVAYCMNAIGRWVANRSDACQNAIYLCSKWPSFMSVIVSSSYISVDVVLLRLFTLLLLLLLLSVLLSVCV